MVQAATQVTHAHSCLELHLAELRMHAFINQAMCRLLYHWPSE